LGQSLDRNPDCTREYRGEHEVFCFHDECLPYGYSPPPDFMRL
jgi:hypothetical protein